MRRSGKITLAVGIVLTAIVGTTAESLADGGVTIGKPVSKPKGTAVLPVTFTQPGTAVLWDAATLRPCGGPPRIKRVDVTVQQPGTLRLLVKPESLIKPDLRQGRRVKVPVAVEFTPANTNVNVPETHVKRLILQIDSKTDRAAVPRC